MDERNMNYAVNTLVRRLIGELDNDIQPESKEDWKAIFDMVDGETAYWRTNKSLD